MKNPPRAQNQKKTKMHTLKPSQAGGDTLENNKKHKGGQRGETVKKKSAQLIPVRTRRLYQTPVIFYIWQSKINNRPPFQAKTPPSEQKKSKKHDTLENNKKR